MLKLVEYLSQNGAELLAAVNALLLGVIAISMLIPGEQPEKFLKKVVEILEKLSRK